MNAIIKTGGNFPHQRLLVSPYPLNLGGAISPLNFGGGVSETPCFTVFSGGRPLNLAGEIVTP